MTQHEQPGPLRSGIRKYGFYLLVAAVAGGFWWFRYKRAPELRFDQISVAASTGASNAISALLPEGGIVHFYATWCGPCMAELPRLADFTRSEEGKAIPVLLVTDDEETKALAVRERFGLPVSTIASLKEIGVYSIPVTYFISPTGEILHKQLGACEWSDGSFRQQVLDYFPKQ